MLSHAIKTLRRNLVSCCLSPLKYGKNFFQKRLFMGGHIGCQFSWAKLLIGSSMETLETWGVTLTRRQACWRNFPGRLGVGWNYLWCLVILIFMRLGRTKRLRGRGGLRVRPTFIRSGELTPLENMGLINYYYVFNTILTSKIQHNIFHFASTT